MDGRKIEKKRGGRGKHGREYGMQEHDKKKYGLKKYDAKKTEGRKWGRGNPEGLFGKLRRSKQYFVAPLVIASVVVTAFFTPQIMFRIQDSVLHRKTEWSRQERMDVEALSSSYEKNIFQRMLNFAEGLALGDSFYVTSRNLAAGGDTAELEEYLKSGYLNEGIGQYAASWDLISLYALEFGYTLSQWKQYVVYSDNYTKGVNFILWFIELVCEDGITVRLLTDAETGMLYALKIQGCRWVGDSEYTYIKYKKFFEPESLRELWLFCASYFGVISTDAQLQELAADSTTIITSNTDRQESETDMEENEDEDILDVWYINGVANGVVDMQPSLEKDTYAAITAYIEDRIEGDWENRLARLRLPYKAASLEIFIEFGTLDSEEKGLSYAYPDILIGVRQLYEMIPEFQ